MTGNIYHWLGIKHINQLIYDIPTLLFLSIDEKEEGANQAEWLSNKLQISEWKDCVFVPTPQFLYRSVVPGGR